MLTAFDLFNSKWLGKIKFLEYFKVDNLISIIFSPAIICFAVSLATVLVTIIQDMNVEFEELREDIRKKYPQIHLYLGGEFYYYSSILEDSPQMIRTINETDYVLVEFSPVIAYDDMLRAFQKLKANGYEVILAHLERYEVLRKNIDNVEHIKDMGIVLQMNANTIVTPFDREHKKFMKRIIKDELVDLVATDAHDLDTRKPCLSKAASYVTKKTSDEYANAIFVENQLKILKGKRII